MPPTPNRSTLNRLSRPVALVTTLVLALVWAHPAAAQQVGRMFNPNQPQVGLEGANLIIHLKSPTERVELGSLSKQQVQAAKKASGLPKGWSVEGLGGGRIALRGPELSPGKKLRLPLKTGAGSIKLRFDFFSKGKSYFDGELEARRPD